jgi:3-dehydrosphinganine reductase
MPLGWFEKKRVVITGGSSGIGKAAGVLCARWGASVCIIARTPSRLEQALEEIRSNARTPDQRVISIRADVADRGQIQNAATSVVNRLEGIDVLINSAGVTWPGYVADTPDSVWDSMIRVDYMGTVNSIRAFLPYFVRQKQGSIANISSVLGYMGVFGYAAYGSAKFAVVGLSECLRQDLLPYGVRVSVVYPPDTDTPMWHEENRIKPLETRLLAGATGVLPAGKVAEALLKGISRGSFTIIPGAMNKVAYYLNRYAPGIVWRIISRQLQGYWKKNSLT